MKIKTIPNKIAITGKMRSGKDTVTDYLVENYGFAKFSFANPVKTLCSDLFSDTIQEQHKPRHIYQFVGEALREIDEEVWVKKTLKNIEASNAEKVIISDLRLLTEYYCLRNLGFTIVKISTREKIRLKRMEKEGDEINYNCLNHTTEKMIDYIKPDYIIENNSSIKTLYTNIEDWIKQVNWFHNHPGQ